MWQPSRLSRLKTFLSNFLKKVTFTGLAVALLVLPLVLYVYREVTRDTLVIDSFTVPKSLEEEGLTADVMANRIGDRIHQIEEEARYSRRKDNLESFKYDGAINQLEIPGAKLDLKTVIDITRSIFGIYPRHVGGDVVILENDSANAKPQAAGKREAIVTIYVTQGRTRNAA